MMETPLEKSENFWKHIMLNTALQTYFRKTNSLIQNRVTTRRET